MLSTCMVTTAVWSCARCQSWWQFTHLVLNTGSEGCHQAEEVLLVHIGQAVPEAKTQVREEFDEAMEDYPTASNKILSGCLSSQEGEAVPCQHCLQYGPGGLDLNWGHYLMVNGIILEAPQSPGMPYIKEARGSEVDSTITQVLGWVAAKFEVKLSEILTGTLVQPPHLGSRCIGP